MQPPFVMDKWMVGIQQNQRVDYIVNYEVSQISCCVRHFSKAMQIYRASCWNIHFQIKTKVTVTPCGTGITILTRNVLIFSFSFDTTLQNDVKSPKSTRHSYLMTWSHNGGQNEIKTVELIIETAPADIDWNPRDRPNSGNCFIYSFVVVDDLNSVKATVSTARQRMLLLIFL